MKIFNRRKNVKSQPSTAVVLSERGDPRPLTDADHLDWMSAAQQREFRIFMEMEFVLSRLAVLWPRRIKVLRKEIHWLRTEAEKYGMDWGTGNAKHVL